MARERHCRIGLAIAMLVLPRSLTRSVVYCRFVSCLVRVACSFILVHCLRLPIDFAHCCAACALCGLCYAPYCRKRICVYVRLCLRNFVMTCMAIACVALYMLACRPDQTVCVGTSVSCAWPPLTLLAACFCLFAENIRIYQTIYRWPICLHAIKCLPLIIPAHSIMEVNYAR